MHTRPFDWRDLPKLHSYRSDTLYLNKALLLTRGPLQTLGAILASVVPTVGIFTSVGETPDQPEQPVIGQVIHNSGDKHAYVSFLAPGSELTPDTLPPLISHLIEQAGGRGMQRVLAELDERSPVLDALRRSGFAVYMRQQVWLLTENGQGAFSSSHWRTANDQDTFSIRVLYSNLVPGLVQQVEPVTLDQPRGLVYYNDDDLLAYVELRYGMRGIWVRPYIHPDMEQAVGELFQLLSNLPSRRARPVYICVSAYESWLGGMLDEVGARPSPRQVLMVKHLTIQKKLVQTLAVPGLEPQPETFAFSDLENN